MVIYRFVDTKRCVDMTKEDVQLLEMQGKIRTIGYNYRLSSREALQGRPKFAGFLGPMYDGELNGSPVIRYETQEAYDLLSV